LGSEIKEKEVAVTSKKQGTGESSGGIKNCIFNEGF
jgi:hypothetical protein